VIDPQRILLIRRKAIGDVLVSMDVARALRERWPEASIHLVVDRFAAPVVERSPLVDEVLVYDRRQQSTGPWWARLDALRSWADRLRGVGADLALDLMGTPQTALWTRLSGARLRVGPRKRFRTWAYHRAVESRPDPVFAGERFLDWVRAIDVEPGPWRPQPMTVSPRDAERVASVLTTRGAEDRALVLLNASATWPAKAWPLEHFARLARRLREHTDAEVALAWGPGEEEAVDTVVREAAGAVWPLPPTTLPELAAWLERADLLVTTDSGPKHLAVAQGTPTVTVFGSTDPRGWQPPGPRHRALTHPVDCHPCNLLECPVPGHPCLDALDPDIVADATVELLARTRSAA
jgi:ADP-heptose:LPS heptosyltransferase